MSEVEMFAGCLKEDGINVRLAIVGKCLWCVSAVSEGAGLKALS